MITLIIINWAPEIKYFVNQYENDNDGNFLWNVPFYLIVWRVWWDDQDGQERDDRSQAEGTQEGNVQVLFPILWQGDKILNKEDFV